MFGTGSGGDADRVATVADLRRRLDRIDGGVAWAAAGRPSDALGGTASGARTDGPGVLAAPAPLAGLLPQGGIPRGSVVSLASTAPGRAGATSLLLSLLAAPKGAWAAVVGLPGFGVVAAAELGVDLARLALVPDPGPDVLQVISVLADGVDLIATAPPRRPSPARLRVLTGRLRQRGAVLLVAGHWPGADLTLTVTQVRWSGIGQGYGRLRDREIDVRVGGRRAGGGAAATLLLLAARSAVTVVAPAVADRRDALPEPAFASAGTG